MECLGEDCRATEHLQAVRLALTNENRRDFAYHTDVRSGMLLHNRAKYAIPVGPAKVGGGTQRGDRVFLCTDILDLWFNKQADSEKSKNAGGAYTQ